MADQLTFTTDYISHLCWLGVPVPSASTLSLLFALYTSVQNNGGWARTIGLNNWGAISLLPQPRRQYEDNFLVSFERKVQNAWPHDAAFTKALDFARLQTIPVIQSVDTNDWESVLAEHIVLIRNVYDYGVPRELMSLDSLAGNYGELDIPIVVQESDTSGFSVKTATKDTMKLGKYIKQMKKAGKNTEFIHFAVNIDFGNWKSEVDTLRKCLPAEILWCSEFDCLKYLRQHIMGMTLPQLYLKVKGCWTGGHEENLRFPSANINHGPSACEWWGLDPTQSLQLRECVKADKGYEIYNSETLWWPDEIYCISKGFNVYHALQQPGDLAIVGCGTIHWVKSCGVTANTAWNFGPAYLNNFRSAFERNFINRAISYKSLVPMHTLAMDLVNYELETLDLGLVEFLVEQVAFINAEELQEFNGLRYKEAELNRTDNVINCEICYQELFRFYYRCEKCVKMRLVGKDDLCFFCYSCATREHKRSCRGKIKAVQKFNCEDIVRIMERVSKKMRGEDCGGVVEELKCPYDKNEEEEVYISSFSGRMKPILAKKTNKIPEEIILIDDVENEMKDEAQENNKSGQD
jgi:hypothetical protein